VCLLASFLTVAVVAAIAFMVALIVVLVNQNNNTTSQQSTTTPEPPGPQMPSWPSPTNSILGEYPSAAIAADNGMCSEIGRDIMIKGGNAVDAVIAATFCIGVLDSQSAGIGGGHFMTFYNRTSKTCYIMDARETAPASAYRDMFVNASDRGYPSIGIPGELYGLRKAYELFGSGRVEWRELLLPTVKLCREGYVVSGSLGEAISEKTNDFWNEPTMRDVFYDQEANRTYRTGEVMKRPILADTLELLANSSDPIKLFYQGDLTNKFIQDFEKYNYTNITLADFANYTARFGEERPAITTTINGLNLVVCGPPPPSSAAITISMLKILAQYNVTPEYLNGSIDNNVETYHRFIEAMKFAYAGRQSLGDMDFVTEALPLARNFTSDWFAQEAMARIMETAYQNQSDYYILSDPNGDALNDHGTAQISALDSDGNAVSLTSTINLFFGSMKRSESTDIIWNNDMADFSTPGTVNPYGYAPTPPNFIEPGKRPLSSMSPIIFYDETTGDARIVTGAAGGSRIISATANVAMRLLWFGQDVKEAIDSPRLHNQVTPFQTEVESGFPQIYVDDLKAKGQNFVPYSTDAASSCSVTRSPQGRIQANSDFRKLGGYPAGF
jgi:gamma-glutamyltranspeptidase